MRPIGFMLMNKENQRDETEERDPNQAMTRNISEEETERALKGMKCGKAEQTKYQLRRGTVLATL